MILTELEKNAKEQKMVKWEITVDERKILAKWREVKKKKFGGLNISLKSDGTECIIETSEKEKVDVKISG